MTSLTDIPADIVEAARKHAAERYVGDHWKHMRTHILGGLYDDDLTVVVAARAVQAERQRCAEIADAHASQCLSKLRKKRSDHDMAIFESAATEAQSIAAVIRGCA